jgi:hypothetical protein
VIVTDHAAVDYARVAERARLIVDTRGAMRDTPARGRVVGLSGATSRAIGSPTPPPVVSHPELPELAAAALPA